jgi:hypothetical protein
MYDFDELNPPPPKKKLPMEALVRRYILIFYATFGLIEVFAKSFCEKLFVLVFAKGQKSVSVPILLTSSCVCLAPALYQTGAAP